MQGPRREAVRSDRAARPTNVFRSQLRRKRSHSPSPTDDPTISIKRTNRKLIPVRGAHWGARSSIRECASWYATAAAIGYPSASVIEGGNVEVHQGDGQISGLGWYSSDLKSRGRGRARGGTLPREVNFQRHKICALRGSAAANKQSRAYHQRRSTHERSPKNIRPNNRYTVTNIKVTQ